jgi:hypothetical protein
VKQRFPRIGSLLLRVVSEPRSASAWAKGAEGERLVGERLDALVDDGVLALHDRRRPGTKANIDHIAVAPTGIYVVDTKNYRGRIERRELGGLFRADQRLYVAGRDRTALTEGVLAQTAAVRTALGQDHPEVPIWSMLCFVSPDIGLFTRPFVVAGVSVTWPRAMQKQIGAPGPFDADTVQHVTELLDDRLRPA